MVYKKYIKRGNKLHGPYYYESYRDESGKIKKRYVGTSLKKEKNVAFFILIGVVLLLFVGSYFLVQNFLTEDITNNLFSFKEISSTVRSLFGDEESSVLFAPVCGDEVCDSGETLENCFEDCTFGNASEDYVFRNYLNFYQVRYGLGSNLLYPPVPEGLAQFTIGDAYDGLEQYIYVSINEIHGHETVSRMNAPIESVILNSSELDTLYGMETGISKDKLQRADIIKIHNEMILSHPELFPYGTELTYGVELNSSGDVILDSNNKPTNDSPLINYQQGKTIVHPTLYNQVYPTRFQFNYNSPAVREYVARYVVQKLGQSRNNSVFIDSAGINLRQIFEDGDQDKPLNYISNGTPEEQVLLYTNQTLEIFREIKTRGNNPHVIKNGLYLHNDYIVLFLNELVKSENFDLVDGIMAENDFWTDTSYFLGENYGLKGYLNWSDILLRNNKKTVYTASGVEDNATAMRIWLWTHLVANNDTYLYMNSADYDEGMTNYTAYKYPLGMPLEGPQRNDDIWTRRYQRGLIVFNVSGASGAGDYPLNGTRITFIEEPTCPTETCGNNFDDDCDGQADEGCLAMICGDGICGVGENYTSCSSDCKIYYASPSGIGDGLSDTTPFQIASFWNFAQPGYVLYLMDGVYNNSNSMIDPPSHLSGTPTNPITIKALNDGKVTIDGEGIRIPVLLYYNDWFVLEGFNAHNSSSNVISIWPPSFYNAVRRVAAWDAREGETTVFAVSTETTLEDCAGWGTGRKIFSAAGYGNDNVTFRRCWGRWEGSHAIGPKMTYEFVYNNYNALVENSIGTWDALKMKESYILTDMDGVTPWQDYAVGGGVAHNSTGVMCSYCNFTNYTVEAPDGIFSQGGMNLDKRTNTRVLGSLAYTQNSQKADSYSGEFYYTRVANLTIKDSVAYTEKNSSVEFATFLLYPPLNWQSNTNFILENSADVRSRAYSAVTPTGQGNNHFYKVIQAGTSGATEPVWPMDGGTVVDNSVIWQDMGELNLNLIDSTSITNGLYWIAPGWNRTNFLNLTYSQGVKIFNSSQEGAELCYRYVNGELTGEPLWPWPMEQRIYDAMVEGGYAEPVNVTQEIVDMFGPIPEECGGNGQISQINCGNGICESGETNETCSLDCQNDFYGMAVESVEGDVNQFIVNTTGASYVLSRTGMEMWRRIDPVTNDYNPRLVARLDFDSDVGALSILSNDKRTAVVDSAFANFTFNSDSFFFVTAKQPFTYSYTNLVANALWNKHFYLDGYYAIPGITEDYRDRMWTDGYGGSLHAKIANTPTMIWNSTDATGFSMDSGDGMGHMVYPSKKFEFEGLYGTNARPFVYSYPNTASLLDNPDSLLDNLSQKGFGVILLWNSFYRPSCMNVAGNATHFSDEQYFPYQLNMSYPCNNTDPVPTWLPFSDAVGYEYRNTTQMKSFVNKAHAKGFKVITYMAASDFHPELNRGGFHAHNQSIENTEIFMRAFQSEYNLDGWYFDNGGIHTGYYPGTNTSLLENYNFMKQVRKDVGDEGIILHHDSVDVWGYWSGLKAVMVDAYATYSLTGETGMPRPQEPASPDEPNDLYLRFYSSGYGMSQAYGGSAMNSWRTLAISEAEKNRVLGENLRSVEWLYGSDEIWNASFKPAYDIARAKYLSHPDVDWPIDSNTGWFRNPTNVQLNWITGAPGISAAISWNTTDNSDTELTYTSNGVWWESIYDVPHGPDRLIDNETMTKQHNVVLRNLKENTFYEFRIRSRNRASVFANKITWGYVGNFTTGNGHLDTDADVLPDEWEFQYFGNLAQGAGDDFDGDGFSNLFEYQNSGLNPVIFDDSTLCNYNGVCSGRENSLSCLHDCYDPNLVAFWNFDDGTGRNVAGNEHQGLVQGAEFLSRGGYNGKGSFYFENDTNFQDDYILMNAVIPKPNFAPEAEIYNNFTITGWIKRDGTGKWDYLTGGLSGGVSYTAVIYDGRLLISYADSTKQQRTCYSSAMVTDTNWHHLAFVGANNADIKIYLDGSDVTSPIYCQQPKDYGGFNSSLALVEWIGKFYTYGFMKGAIDDVSVWKKALNNSDVCGIAGGEWNGTGCAAMELTSLCLVDLSSNLVENPCMENDSNSDGQPDNWTTFADEFAPPADQRNLTWQNGFTTNPTKVLKTQSSNESGGWPTRFGWAQYIPNIQPNTWYKFSADLAIENLEPYLIYNETTGQYSMSEKAPLIGLSVDIYNSDNRPLYSSEFGDEILGFHAYGLQMLDWNETTWNYRTVGTKNETWRTQTQYFKTPPDAGWIHIRTNNAPIGTAYVDNILLEEVSPAQMPYNPDFKKSGNLSFLKFKGDDFFPILSFGYPKITGNDLSVGEMENEGFNTMFFSHEAYSTPSVFQSYLSSQHPNLAVFGNSHTRYYALESLGLPYRWIDLVRSGLNPDYLGAKVTRSQINEWSSFDQLLFYYNVGGEDEIDLYGSSVAASYLPELRSANSFNSYAHSRGLLTGYNFNRAFAPYTGNTADMYNYYYPLADVVSFTDNTHSAYPQCYSAGSLVDCDAVGAEMRIYPELPSVGERTRRAIESSASVGHNLSVLAFGTGAYQWTSWDGVAFQLHDQHRYVPFNLQRFQVFNELINGAVGVGFHGIYTIDTNDAEYGIYFAHSWNQIKAITQEISSLEDVFLEPEFYDEWNVNDSRVNAMLKKHSGKIYLLTASTAYEDLRNVQFNITGNYTIVKITAINDIVNGDFENPQNRTIPVVGNSFTDDFIGENVSSPQGLDAPGYAVHVYEIEYGTGAEICGDGQCGLNENPDSCQIDCDTDLDGMSDDWEINYFSDLSENYNLDEDGDGLTNLDEYLLDNHPEALVGSNPIVADSGNDADGDGFSNLAEKQGVKMTDPVDSGSYPGDGNLILNPGIFWHSPINAFGPDKWYKSVDNENHTSSWIVDPIGSGKGKMFFQEFYTGRIGSQTTPAWRVQTPSIVGVKPETWYEFSATYTSDGVEPLFDSTGVPPQLNSKGFLSHDTDLFGVRILLYNDTLDWRAEEPTLKTGIVNLADWDDNLWLYHTYAPSELESWRNVSTYFKTGTNTTKLAVTTIQYPKGRLYVDKVSVKEVNISGVNRDPLTPDFKKSGTLEFIKMDMDGDSVKEDFFPIILFGVPANDSGSTFTNYSSFVETGFNTVGRTGYSASVVNELRANGLATMPGLNGFTYTYGAINSAKWLEDSEHLVPYSNSSGSDRILISSWAGYEKLLGFEIPDELPVHQWSNGMYIPKTNAISELYDYIHMTAPDAYAIGDLGEDVYTAVFQDLMDYYSPYVDVQTFTVNTPPAYPNHYLDYNPVLNRAGDKTRKILYNLNQSGMNKKMFAFALGVRGWNKWDNVGTPYVPYNLQRYQIWTQIVNGAVGVQFWGTNYVNMTVPYSAYHYEQIKVLASELSSLQEVLLEPKFYDEWNVSDKRVEIMMKKHAGKIYLFAVSNHYEDLQDVEITLNPIYTITKITSLNDVVNGDIANPIDRDIVPLAANSFRDDFVGENSTAPQGKAAPGYAVHVYEIEYVTETGGCGNGVCESGENYTSCLDDCRIYYASPNGLGDGLSETTPFRVSNFSSFAKPGYALYLLDGVYTGVNSMIKPVWHLSGTATNPITVRAFNEGQVWIDGEATRIPVHLELNNSWFVIEGINVRNSSNSVVKLESNSSHNIIRRVVACDAKDDNTEIFGAHYGANNNLFEDCAGFGTARKIYQFSYGGDHNICRRCWGRWEGSHVVGPKETYSLAYNNYQTLVENSIGTWDEIGMKKEYLLEDYYGNPWTGSAEGVAAFNSTGGLVCNYCNFTNYTVNNPVEIFGLGPFDIERRANTSIFGSIAYTTKEQNVSPALVGGFYVLRAANVKIVDSLSYMEKENRPVYLGAFNYWQPNKKYYLHDRTLSAVIPSSIFNGHWYEVVSLELDSLSGSSEPLNWPTDGGIVVDNHVIWHDAGLLNLSFTNSTIIGNYSYYVLGWNVTNLLNATNISLAYSRSESIFNSTRGAEICYRYENGILTNEPLWPWPMEQRIYDAMVEGGYAEPVNVTQEIVDMFGPIPAECLESPQIPSVEYCGDGICNSDESCSSCSSDCGSCQTGNGNGGGGGGGGGNPLVNLLFGNQNCSELWQCGSWSDCQNGTRTRSCYDIHACGTNDYRPQFEEFCGEQLISSEELLLIYGEIRWDIVLAVVISFVGLSGIIVSLVIMILRRQSIQKKRQELLRNVAKSQE